MRVGRSKDKRMNPGPSTERGGEVQWCRCSGADAVVYVYVVYGV